MEKTPMAEYMKEYMKEYRKKNKDWNKKYKCEICNIEYNSSCKTNHMKTKKHEYGLLKMEYEKLKKGI